MSKSVVDTLWHVSSFLIASVCLTPAQSVFVGGPSLPGQARPPLRVNAQPATATYYTPAQVRHAYGFDQLSGDGAGQTIAIVDAYGDPSILKDVSAFCNQFGLPSVNLTIAYPQGAVRLKNSGWALETALDVEWAHAIAPGANILLVVAKSASFNNLLGAVDYAVGHGATAVSMSWGGSDSSSDSSFDSHFTASGVTFVASSGDSGESTGVEYPAASPYVVAVGGTSLYLDANGNYLSESGWSGSGGGLSLYESEPLWQRGWDSWAYPFTSLNQRGVPDVSYLADPNTGVLVVQGGAWYVVGGTSVGAPQWAALVALANQSRSTSLSSTGKAIYSQAGTAPNVSSTCFFDITSGNNGSASDPDDFAGANYDLVTGLGSPVANHLVPALSGY